MRGRRLHEALHGPQLAAEARQEPHGRGTAAVPPLQGPGQRSQAQLVPLLHRLIPIVHLDDLASSEAAAATDDGNLAAKLDDLEREAAGAADADQLGALLVGVVGDDARRGAAVGRHVRLGGGGDGDDGGPFEPDRATATSAPTSAGEEELGWRQR